MATAAEGYRADTVTDLGDAVRAVLAASTEPLTPARIQERLPASFRPTGRALSECLERLGSLRVLHEYPRYRSRHPRYWDRPMLVHLHALLRQALAGGPLAWSDLVRKLPAYARPLMSGTAQEQLVGGMLYQHPRLSRGRERFGLAPPDPKVYLRPRLTMLLVRLERLGLSREALRAGALEILHEEEWGAATS